MKNRLSLFLSAFLLAPVAVPQPVEKDLGVQLAANPPMVTIKREPPPLPVATDTFETRDGFTLITTLDEFRAVTKHDGQKIRMKPGVYRAETVDPPLEFTGLRTGKTTTQEHIFAVTGSDNHFDLRGVVFETPVSLQSTLTRKTHMADSWRIAGSGNTFEGAYFRNVVDKDYLGYTATENEFEIVNDGTTFLDCVFVVKGSGPYGYSDYYGKGPDNYTRLNKHSFMSLEDANDTRIIGCEVYNQSFGHAIHFHKVDGVLIEDTLIAGTLRPTNDIFKEKEGVARDHNFNIMYRGEKPIPRNEVIPLTEDAIRSYNETENIVVRNTTVERQRGCFQLLTKSDVTLENVTVRECGDFSYDISSGRDGKVVMKNCFADLAYNPVFNLTRGEVPYEAFYEVTVLSPAEGVRLTQRSGLGTICGEKSTFIFHDGTTGPISPAAFQLTCGGKKPLTDSTVTNYTRATITLEKNVRNCTIESVGRVIDRGENNTVERIRPVAKEAAPAGG